MSDKVLSALVHCSARNSSSRGHQCPFAIEVQMKLSLKCRLITGLPVVMSIALAGQTEGSVKN